MKKLVYLLFICFLFYGCQDTEELETSNSKLAKPSSANTWQPTGFIGSQGRYSSTSFSIGDKGYLMMGFLKDVWEFDPASGKWTRKADFPGAARAWTFSFVIGNKGYIGGGWIGGAETYSPFREFWEYSPANDTWTKKADYPGKGVRGAVGFSIGGEGFAGTGYGKVMTEIPADEDEQYQNDFWKYNPSTDTWKKIANFPGCPRAFSTAFVIDEFAFVGTGTTHASRNDNTKDFYKYSPATNSWTRIADFAGDERAFLVSFSINGKGYAGTGRGVPYPVSYGPTEEYNDFWEYNPATNKWTQKADFGGGNRLWATGFAIRNKGYIGTGAFEWDVYKNDFWEYSPD